MLLCISLTIVHFKMGYIKCTFLKSHWHHWPQKTTFKVVESQIELSYLSTF